MTTKANYRRIIGNEAQNLSPGMPVDRFSPRTLEAAIVQSLSQNPSVTAAMYNVDVAQLQVKIAEAGLYPTLALFGSVQQQQFIGSDFDLKILNSAVLTRLTVPIYQGGSEYSAIRQNKEAVGQQRLNLDQVRDQVRANVAQYWGQVQATKAQTEAAERQVKYAESALNGVRDEARVGQRTTLDVLNAIQALLNARVSLITAQHVRVVASYNLLSAVGADPLRFQRGVLRPRRRTERRRRSSPRSAAAPELPQGSGDRRRLRRQAWRLVCGSLSCREPDEENSVIILTRSSRKK
jgi:outer membrane protein